MLMIVEVHVNLTLADERLQKDILALQFWFHDMELTINTRKTKLFHMRSPHLNPNIDIRVHDDDIVIGICDTRIEVVKSMRYVGAVVDNRVLQDGHPRDISVKLRYFSSCSYLLGMVLWRVLKLIYCGLVQSVITYGLTV